MGLKGWIRSKVINFLEIKPATSKRVTIHAPYSFENEVMRNIMWYQGDATQLQQFYMQAYSQTATGINTGSFWQSSALSGSEVRKRHTGLPQMIVDTIASIVISDMEEVQFEDGVGAAEWEEITQYIDFEDVVLDGVTKALYMGDGAFKIEGDTDLLPVPTISFVGADRTEYKYKRGVIQHVDFHTQTHDRRGERIVIIERYSKNKEGATIEYMVIDGEGSQVDNSRAESLQDIQGLVFSNSTMLAIPLIIYKNSRHEGRGKALFDSKIDSFDALDEVASQWQDAIRSGRVQRYIPEDLIPRSPETGALAGVNRFGTDFIKIGSNDFNKSMIETEQPNIQYEAFVNSYAAQLDQCLQGMISPATLGINIGKVATAESQRERKDITGFTRGHIVRALEKVLPEVISATIHTYNNMNGKPSQEYKPMVSFGEYGSPDFESKVDTIGKASSYSVMSIETQVDELWGDSKPEEWKEEEVARIKKERGITEYEEPEIDVGMF